MVKVTDTITSEGVAMLANWVFISERTYSNFSGYTGAQAFWYSSKTTPRMPWMMRCSVAVKSRPSTRV